MAVTLLAVVVALVIGHMAQSLAASVRHYDWYGNWLDWLDAQFPEGGVWRGRWGVALALLPPLLAVGLLQLALREPLYGLVGLLFGIFMLFYAWGPRDLDLDIDAIVNAPDAASRREAMLKLWPDGAPSIIDGSALVSAVFWAEDERAKSMSVLLPAPYSFCLPAPDPFGRVMSPLGRVIWPQVAGDAQAA